MIDVSELMADPDFAKTITLRRPSGTFASEGVFTPSYDEQDITAIVQPAQPADLNLFPEGTRIDDLFSVWSAVDLSIGDGKTAAPDVLVIDGAPYRVIKLEDRQDNGYFRAFATGFVP